MMTAKWTQRSLLTAHGETMSLGKWLNDPRCEVGSVSSLARRLEFFEPEQAMLRSPDTPKGKLYEAFGQRKTLPMWASDPTCKVTRSTLFDRVRQGMAIEEALSRPANDVVRLGRLVQREYTAHGETKSLSLWAEDPRCVVSRQVLELAVRKGVSFEGALQGVSPKLRGGRMFTAFGEEKTAAEWLLDPRCKVRADVFRARLRAGEAVESAMTRQLGQTRYVTAFGETKSISDWVLDPRCGVSGEKLWTRLKSGFAPEAAMASDVVRRTKRPAKTLRAFGEDKTFAQWAKDPRCLISFDLLRTRIRDGHEPEAAMTNPDPIRFGKLVSAFGELKSIGDWAKDSRAKVRRETIRKRLAAGTDAESAITDPPIAWKEDGTFEGKVKPRRGTLVTAYGESKSIGGWAKDPRAWVSEQTIRDRIREGVHPELAITTPAGYEGGRRHGMGGQGRPLAPKFSQLFKAFGELKSLADWLEDPRCLVGRKELLRRISRGVDFERALRPVGYKFPGRPVTAFDETKSIMEWLKDPRCRVSEGQLRERLKLGIQPESAMDPEFRRIAPILFEGFGEKKGCNDWFRDPRCKICKAELYRRLTEGMPVEQALTYRHPVVLVEAFGEAKTIGAWASDPRARVLQQAIGNRIKRGWTPERAITTPGVSELELPAAEEGRVGKSWSKPSVRRSLFPIGRETGVRPSSTRRSSKD